MMMVVNLWNEELDVRNGCQPPGTTEHPRCPNAVNSSASGSGIGPIPHSPRLGKRLSHCACAPAYFGACLLAAPLPRLHSSRISTHLSGVYFLVTLSGISPGPLLPFLVVGYCFTCRIGFLVRNRRIPHSISIKSD